MTNERLPGDTLPSTDIGALRAAQQEVLQQYDGASATQNLIQDTANPFSGLGRIVDKLGLDTLLRASAHYNGVTYSATMRLRDAVPEERQAIMHETEGSVASLFHALATNLANTAAEPITDERQMQETGESVAMALGSIAQEVQGRNVEAVLEKQQQLFGAIKSYAACEEQIRAAMDPRDYLRQKAMEHVSEITKRDITTKKGRLVKYYNRVLQDKYIDPHAPPLTNSLWRNWSNSKNSSPDSQIDAIVQAPENDSDPFDDVITELRDAYSKHNNHHNLYGGELHEAAANLSTDRLDKAAATIRELVAAGFRKAAIYDYKPGGLDQLQLAVDLLQHFTEQNPDFDPYKAGLTEAYDLLITGVAAIEADFSINRNWPDTFEFMGKIKQDIRALLAQLDKIQVTKIAPLPSNDQTPTQIGEPIEDTADHAPQPNQPEHIDASPEEQRLRAAFADPYLKGVRTDEVLKAMRKEGEAATAYLYDKTQGRNIPAADIARRIAVEIFQADDGENPTAKFIQTMYTLCLDENGSLDTGRLKAEVAALREALTYLQHGDRVQTRQRLHVIYQILEDQRQLEENEL